MIEIARCLYCDHVEKGETQDAVAASLGKHFTVAHPGQPPSLSWETPVSDPAALDRTLVVARIQARLAESDVWAVRHVEDGISLTPERIAYRKQLRTLLDSVATSDDPASIEIPDAPPPPKS